MYVSNKCYRTCNWSHGCSGVHQTVVVFSLNSVCCFLIVCNEAKPANGTLMSVKRQEWKKCGL